jgi:hypothetical protein
MENKTIEIQDAIRLLEIQLTDVKRIISHATESKVKLEANIERLYAFMRGE